MFYRNTRYHFKLPEGAPEDIGGGILSSAAIGYHQLGRPSQIRKFQKLSYLRKRLLDPQLYLSGLDPVAAKTQVETLATYPWFVDADVPRFDTRVHRRLDVWEAEFIPQLARQWTRTLPTDPALVERRTRAAIAFQQALECEAVILPSPLTVSANAGLENEMLWLDTGLAVARELNIRVPVLATLAVKQDILLGYNPEESPFLAAAADQYTARDVDGVYLVMEQAEDSYSIRDANTLRSLFALTDDIARIGQRRVIVNHLGLFGAMLTAAGADTWASDFYRSCRRIRLPEMDDSDGRQRPRFLSTALLGDVGLDTDLDRVASAGLLQRVASETPPAQELLAVLTGGGQVAQVEPWRYAIGNVTAAKGHYLWGMNRVGRLLHGLAREQRVSRIHRGLQSAERLAEKLLETGIQPSAVTELRHQSAWREAFEWWMARAGYR
jgi:hypothetical protein